jgi:hypothetical protein
MGGKMLLFLALKRSPPGAKMFCRILGYISTVRKQSLNVLAAFISLFSGHLRSPIPQPE